MFWSSDGRLGVPGVAKVMPHKRFRKITEYFHMFDNTLALAATDANHDRLFTVRPLLNMANSTFRTFYQPRRVISIDEAMVPFKGRSFLRQYMPVKPIKWGIKV